MEIKNQLEEKIENILSGEIDDIEVRLERPADESHGDWSSNVALMAAGKLKVNPREFAEKIKNELEKELGNLPIEEISIAGPGFINFKISKNYYTKILGDINDSFGKIDIEQSRRVMVEFGDPNTHKLPHIGHLYSYIVGASFANLHEFTGDEVLRVNYQGDVGPHVAKAIYGWRKNNKPEPETLLEKVVLLQECYQIGSKDYDESEEVKAEIQSINRGIYLKDPETMADWKKTRQWSLDYYLQFEKRLGIDQKFHYLESQIWERGMRIVKDNIGKVFKKSEDAIVFPGEDFGLHTRVFITKQDTPTYECKDMGLNIKKMEDWSYDLNLITTAKEQNAYFDVVIKALGQAMPELEGKVKHIGFGLVSLSTGKMSSRSGKILSGQQLLDEVELAISEIINSRENIEEKDRQSIIKKVSLAAVKYAFLRSNILQDMAFDLKESISFDGNSGPYLLYTYARIQSVLSQKPENISEKVDLHALGDADLEITKWLERYPEVIENAAKNYAPHLISNYIFELAQRFNSFYKENSINNADSPELVAARRLLADKVAIVLKSGLSILGIETVDRM